MATSVMNPASMKLSWYEDEESKYKMPNYDNWNALRSLNQKHFDGSVPNVLNGQFQKEPIWHPTVGQNTTDQTPHFYQQFTEQDMQSATTIDIFHEGIKETSAGSILLGRIAPLRQTNRIEQKKRTYRFNARLLQRQTFETLPDFVTYDIEEKEITLNRIGMAITFLRESLKTPEGQMIYGELVKQLGLNLDSTMKFTTIYGLLSAHREVDWYIKNTHRGMHNEEALCKLENEFFFRFSKKNTSYIAYLGVVGDYFKWKGFKLDTVLLPPDSSMAMIMNFTERREVATTVSFDNGTMSKGTSDIPIDEVQGVTVDMCPTLDLKDVNMQTEIVKLNGLFRGTALLSEYYRMNSNNTSYEMKKKKGSSSKDIQIYSLKQTDWIVIRFLNAWDNNQMFSMNKDTGHLDFNPRYRDYVAKNSKDSSEVLPFTTSIGNGQRALVGFVSEIDAECVSGDNLDTTVKSIVDRFESDRFNYGRISTDLKNGLKILNAIENTPYNSDLGEKMLDVIRRNVTTTNAERAKKLGHSVVREFKTGPGGLIDLPEPGPNETFPTYPFGFTTFDCLRSIVAKKDSLNSHWKTLARELEPFVESISDLARHVSKMLPHSALLNEDNLPIEITSGRIENLILKGLFKSSPSVWVRDVDDPVTFPSKDLEQIIIEDLPSIMKEDEKKKFASELMKYSSETVGFDIANFLTFLDFLMRKQAVSFEKALSVYNSRNQTTKTNQGLTRQIRQIFI